MAGTSFFVAGDRAAIIANDSSSPRYRGAVYQVPVGAQIQGRNSEAELVFFVQRGTMEFMVAGASDFVAAGGFMRVRAGESYAYRNAGYETAQLLVRAETPRDRKVLRTIVLEFAA
jgi:glyoxylate utilization-related uncharacterized protein